MKNLLTASLALFLLFILSAQVLAQAAWEAPLKVQMAKVEALTSSQGLAELVPTFERIAAANPKALYAQYYAAHYNLLLHWAAGEDGCETCVEKTDAYLSTAEALAPNDSEVMTLRASYYQAMLGLHPMRAPYYGPKAGNLLEAALKADPQNPRAASLMGQNLYYTPSMFGGGVEKARPYLARAVQLFDVEQSNLQRNSLLPTWGGSRARAMHSKTLATAE